MSWYFFGGFSAYLSVPSGRRWNHSGCSLSHGWSGEQLIAKSSAMSMPCSAAAATSASKSSIGAELGMDRVVAAGLVADRPRAAGVVGAGVERVVAALAVRVADRVDRRQVEDVEAELGAGAGAALRRRLKPPNERGNSSYQEPKRAERAVDVDLERRGQLGGLRRAARDASTSASELGVERGRRSRVGERRGGAPRRARRRPRPVGGVAEDDRALAELAAQVGLAGLELARDLVAPAGEDVDPRLDRPLR